jgi:hypothetical protein
MTEFKLEDLILLGRWNPAVLFFVGHLVASMLSNVINLNDVHLRYY